MRNLGRIKLGMLCLGLMLFECKSKEQIVMPDPITSIKNDYLKNKLSIKDFSFPDASAKVPLEYNPQEDYIILTLPENFKGDLIAPTINLTNNATQISPKSGEKVFFEGKRAIEYTVTKKDGQTVKFNLYVVRQDKLDIEVFTKEIRLNSKDDNIIWMRVNNFGTYGSPQVNDSQNYKQVNSSIVRVFNSVNKLVYSTQFSTNGKDSTGFSIYKDDYEFLKKGDFTMSFSMNEDTLFGKARKSDTFSFRIINGDKAFISPYYSFENFWTINNKEYLIKGVNFDLNKKYSLIFKNDFFTPTILLPKYIDENTLSITIPNDIDTVQYNVLLKENENLITEREGYVKSTPFNNFRGCSFYDTENYWSQIISSKQLSFSKNEVFGAYYVVSYGNMPSEAYKKGDLKLVNVNDRREYLLKGKLVTGIWDGAASLWSFSIPEIVPKGFYEVYAINEQINPERYWRKLEVK